MSGETPEQAAVREIQEELGVTVTGLRRLEPIDITNASGPVIFHMFAAWQWLGGEPSLRGDEHSKLRWFDVEEACRLDDLALEEYRTSFRSLAKYQTFGRCLAPHSQGAAFSKAAAARNTRTSS